MDLTAHCSAQWAVLLCESAGLPGNRKELWSVGSVECGRHDYAMEASMTVRALVIAIVLSACGCVATAAGLERMGQEAVGTTAAAASRAASFSAAPVSGGELSILHAVRPLRTTLPSVVKNEKPTLPVPADTDGENVASRLKMIAGRLSQLSQLDLTNDVEWTTEGPACYLSDSDLAHPERVLYDGQLAGQGLFLIPGEPFTVKMTFASYQRIQSVQVLYAGEWDAAGIPEVGVIGVLSGGESQQIGILSGIAEPPQRQPIVQQLNFAATPAGKDNDWRRIYLEFKDVPPRMGLVEVRVVGFDRDVKNIARALHSLSQTPEDITSGSLSSVAAMTRARRVPGAKSAMKDEVVAELSAMVTELSGLHLEIEFGEQDASGDEPSLAAKIGVRNDSDIGLEWSMVKLELPPGWRAAPSRFTVEELAPHEGIFLPLTFWPGPDTRQTPSAYLYGAYNGQPIFVMTPSPLHENTSK